MSLEELGNEFKSQGYVVLDGIVSAEEVSAARAQMSAVLDISLPEDLRSKLSLDEKWEWLRKHKPTLKSHAYDVMGKLDSIVKILTKREVHDLARNILNAPVLVDLMQVRFDGSDNTRVLPMHQERGQISHKEITVWIPLQDITENTGGVKIIKGSHQLGDLGIQVYDEEKMYTGVPEQYLAGKEETKVLMKAGQVLMFHWDLIHGSYSNQSDLMRLSAICRLNSINETPYLTDESAPLRIPKKC